MWEAESIYTATCSDKMAARSKRSLEYDSEEERGQNSDYEQGAKRPRPSAANQMIQHATNDPHRQQFLAGLYSRKPVEMSIFDGETVKTLLSFRGASKVQRDQVDRYLRNERFKAWNLPEENFIRTLGKLLFFDFDPTRSIKDQCENDPDKILLLTVQSKDGAGENLKYFKDPHNNIKIYVIVPEYTETIEDSAFDPLVYNEFGHLEFHSNDLSKVYLGSSVTKIGRSAFTFCKKLTKIRFPPKLKEIGREAFYETPRLENVRFPRSLQIIGFRGFKYSHLKSIEFPDSDKDLLIGDSAFDSCVHVRTIVLPDRNVTIEQHAFHKCGQSCHVIFPRSVLTLEKFAINKTAFYLASIAVVQCSYAIFEELKDIFKYVRSGHVHYIFYEKDK